MADQKHFSENLNELFVVSQFQTREIFAHKLELDRSTFSRLINGKRRPSPQHLQKIAEYAGVSREDLFLPLHDFRELIQFGSMKSDILLHSLRTTKQHLQICKSKIKTYEGQYVIYNQKDTDGYVNASLLDIEKVTKEGVTFRLVNPYIGEHGIPSCFLYRGYMLFVSEFLYFVGEQEDRNYEILTMIFHGTPLARAQILQGLWSGIGVKDDRRYVASVPAVALRRQNRIEDWQAAINIDLGHIKEETVPAVARKRLTTSTVVVSS